MNAREITVNLSVSVDEPAVTKAIGEFRNRIVSAFAVKAEARWRSARVHQLRRPAQFCRHSALRPLRSRR